MMSETVRPGSLRQRPLPEARGATMRAGLLATALNAGNPVGQLSPLRSSNGPASPCTALYRRDHSTRQRTAGDALDNLSLSCSGDCPMTPPIRYRKIAGEYSTVVALWSAGAAGDRAARRPEARLLCRSSG